MMNPPVLASAAARDVQPVPVAAPRRHGRLVLALSALWTLPIWLTTYPPMVDYPQHLAMAAIVRWFHDPARRFAETYELALTRPNSLFELSVAALSTVLPIELAGRLVIALAVFAVGPAALALARHTRRPDWYALIALAATYGFAFDWGFVGNLLALPVLLGGLVVVDRSFERRFGVRSWLVLAGLVASFYFTHLQFLFVFAGALGWLALARLPPWRRLLLWLSPTLPGIALAIGCWLATPTRLRLYQEWWTRGRAGFTAIGDKLDSAPSYLFGAHEGSPEFVLSALLAALLFVLVGFRPADPLGSPRQALLRLRFPALALWMLVLYLVLPMNLIGGFVYQRMPALALMSAVAALPQPPSGRALLAKLLVGALCAAQLILTTTGAATFEQEARGARLVLAHTEPGKNLAGLMFERSSTSSQAAPLFLQFPALYQVHKGGRISFSFAEYQVSIAQYRAGQDWDDLIARFTEWSPGAFVYERDGARFDYFLLHGSPQLLPRVFGRHLGELDVISRGRWHLVARKRP